MLALHCTAAGTAQSNLLSFQWGEENINCAITHLVEPPALWRTWEQPTSLSSCFLSDKTKLTVSLSSFCGPGARREPALSCELNVELLCSITGLTPHTSRCCFSQHNDHVPISFIWLYYTLWQPILLCLLLPCFTGKLITNHNKSYSSHITPHGVQDRKGTSNQTIHL